MGVFSTLTKEELYTLDIALKSYIDKNEEMAKTLDDADSKEVKKELETLKNVYDKLFK